MMRLLGLTPTMTANGDRRHGTSTSNPARVEHADLIGERHVHVFIRPRFVHLPAARPAAERPAEVIEPDVEIPREARRRRTPGRNRR